MTDIELARAALDEAAKMIAESTGSFSTVTRHERAEKIGNLIALANARTRLASAVLAESVAGTGGRAVAGAVKAVAGMISGLPAEIQAALAQAITDGTADLAAAVEGLEMPDLTDLASTVDRVSEAVDNAARMR